jgi:hypothetical protein
MAFCGLFFFFFQDRFCVLYLQYCVKRLLRSVPYFLSDIFRGLLLAGGEEVEGV